MGTIIKTSGWLITPGWWRADHQAPYLAGARSSNSPYVSSPMPPGRGAEAECAIAERRRTPVPWEPNAQDGKPASARPRFRRGYLIRLNDPVRLTSSSGRSLRRSMLLMPRRDDAAYRRRSRRPNNAFSFYRPSCNRSAGGARNTSCVNRQNFRSNNNETDRPARHYARRRKLVSWFEGPGQTRSASSIPDIPPARSMTGQDNHCHRRADAARRMAPLTRIPGGRLPFPEALRRCPTG